MAHITKHDAKLEGKGDDGENRRVYFLIPGNPVCVHDFLEREGEVVQFEEGRWRKVKTGGVVDCQQLIVHSSSVITFSIEQIGDVLDFGDVLVGHPEDPLIDVVLELLDSAEA